MKWDVAPHTSGVRLRLEASQYEMQIEHGSPGTDVAAFVPELTASDAFVLALDLLRSAAKVARLADLRPLERETR